MRVNGWQARSTVGLLALCLALFSASCGEAPTQSGNSEVSSAEGTGFQAVITGAYEGEVSGRGVLVWVPQAGFEKQGAYFLADGRGVRPHGVTFSLPRHITPGTHELENPSPFEAGSVPSVRVDRDLGNATLSADRNTSGVLNLTAFPTDPTDLRGADVAGDFAFETEDREGRRIRVKGRFSFKVR